jgi:hypothetical protein
MGFITEMATGMPGGTGEIPQNVTPVAEMLRLNGYSTGAFGKWHETATWETVFPVLSIVGHIARALISSMDSLVAKPISGPHLCMTEPTRLNYRKIQTTIL